MSSVSSKLTARVRDILRGGPGAAAVTAPSSAAAPAPTGAGMRLAEAAAKALGGDVVASPRGPCVVIDRVYAPVHRHGSIGLGECARYASTLVPGFSALAGAAAVRDVGSAPEALDGTAPGCAAPLHFLDLETTGLAGGAGTFAFLVGCAWFEGEAFRVRQFFMVGHALERALLTEVRRTVEGAAGLVTYNGKSFDVPVLENRYCYHRETPPFGDRPHLDMLPPARRLWRYARPALSVPGWQAEGCSLITLERALFGLRRTGDVPGFEIPTRYFTFLRAGDAMPLEPVLEHNRLDLLSLAALTARALRLLEEGAEAASQPRECYGLGRLFERAGSDADADACYARALASTERSWHADDELVRAEVLRIVAIRCRRDARYADAARHWEAVTRLRRCPPALLREALEALAIHHEHRAKDLEQARLFAERTRQLATGTRHEADVDQRLSRLRRKMGRAARAAGPRPDSLWH